MAKDYGIRTKQVVIVLGQHSGSASLSEIADVTGAPPSSIQRALETLCEEGIVDSIGQGHGRRYRLSEGRGAQAYLTYSLLSLAADEALSTVCRANQAVEFAGRDRAGLLVVLSPFADPVEIVLLRQALELLVSDGQIRAVEMMDRSDLKRRLLDDSRLLARGRSLEIIKGSSERTFGDPRRHAAFDAKPLGHLHESLNRPSQRRMRELARRNTLRRLSVFGSAVHEDFRPDSDVDVLVEPRPGKRLSISTLMDVQHELEDVFGRDVDVIGVGGLPDEVRERAERDAVRLYG